jgi:hypothetical protein
VLRHGSLTIINSTFVANQAVGGASNGQGVAGQGLGGALFIDSSANACLENISFLANHASSFGSTTPP